MNILILPSWYVSEKDPVNGSFFREQALALKKAGHNVYVIDATLQSRKNYFSKRNFRLLKYEDEGLKVYSNVMPALGFGNNHPVIYKIFKKKAFTALKAMRKDGVEIDLIHAHSFFPAGTVAVDIKKEFNIPFVITEHSSALLKREVDEFDKAHLNRTLKQCERFICVSKRLGEEVKAITGYEGDIEVIPNMVSNEFKLQCNEKLSDEFKFISIGRLDEGKNHILLLKAFNSTFKGNPKVKLDIVGEGLLKDKLKEYIEANSLEDQVRLLGSKTRKETARLLNKSQVFVLPSLYETFGVTYIEALACGKPIIGTRNGGAESIIKEYNGILVDNNDEEALYKSLVKIYKEYDSFKEEEISRKALKEYSEESVCESLLETYEKVIKKELR